MAALYTHQLFQVHIGPGPATLSGNFAFPFDWVEVRDINAVVTAGFLALSCGILVNIGGFWVMERSCVEVSSGVGFAPVYEYRWTGRQMFGGEAEWIVSSVGTAIWDVIATGYVLSP